MTFIFFLISISLFSMQLEIEKKRTTEKFEKYHLNQFVSIAYGWWFFETILGKMAFFRWSDMLPRKPNKRECVCIFVCVFVLACLFSVDLFFQARVAQAKKCHFSKNRFAESPTERRVAHCTFRLDVCSFKFCACFLRQHNCFSFMLLYCSLFHSHWNYDTARTWNMCDSNAIVFNWTSFFLFKHANSNFIVNIETREWTEEFKITNLIGNHGRWSVCTNSNTTHSYTIQILTEHCQRFDEIDLHIWAFLLYLLIECHSVW